MSRAEDNTGREEVLRAVDIYKSFGTIEVLKSVSLELKKEEILAIIGASGAGKTTLLQILGSLERPDSGKIYIKNKELTRLKPKALAEFRNRNIGFIFQFHQLLPEFSALENVAMPALILGLSRAEAHKKAEKLLTYLKMSHRLGHKPASLSGGEKQRVAVARALINEPEVILADEPSGALDSVHKHELHNLILKLREEKGQSFIVVTHDSSLESIADRSITLVDGKTF